MTASPPTSPAGRGATLAGNDTEPAPPEFPGCRAVRITRDAIADFEGRIEYWDAATETAWMVCEPTTVYHEGPGQRLARLAALIAAGRGSPITTLGTSDLQVVDARGERQRIMQADQIVYVHPVETVPRGAAVEVGADHLPDVLLEVDYSTDVRRGKLGLYEAWGFPEVWVEVPDAASPSRSRRRPSGLTIHRLGPGGYRPAAASAAFPGWTAAEIHAALNEARLSEATSAVLTRVGRALGDAEGPTMTRGCASNAGKPRWKPSRRSFAPAGSPYRRTSQRVWETRRRATSSTPPSRAGTARTSSPARRRATGLRPDGGSDRTATERRLAWTPQRTDSSPPRRCPESCPAPSRTASRESAPRPGCSGSR